MSQGNITIMMIMMLMVMLFPLSFLHYGRGVKVMDAYLGGANVQSSVRFLGSGRQVHPVTMNNYYLRDFFDEAWLTRAGVRCGGALLAIMLGFAAWSTVLAPAGDSRLAPGPAAAPTKPIALSPSLRSATDNL